MAKQSAPDQSSCFQQLESFIKILSFVFLDVNRSTVVQFIWDLIEFFHISPGKILWEIENAPMNAKDILLKWLNSKLGGKVKNFTTDWNDGTVLCELVNALDPGLIPARVYLQGSWPQKNVKVAMETAEKNWGIPLIISPDDMICSEVDELSVMTYIALIFEYDLERNSTNQSPPLSNGHAEIESIENNDFKENKEKNVTSENIKIKTKRKPEFGKVGRDIEYRLDLHDVNANEITVSVEFKPAEKLTQDYKPDLKVFSMGKGRFRVKYTPNLAGNYRLCMYYKDEHIADSPYCVEVLPELKQENDRMDSNNNKNKNKILNENCSSNGHERRIESSEMLAEEGFYGFDGEGLKQATVGKLAVFTVITDNRDKGPLSVCINCPAVSLPVPHVKTTCSKNYSTHTVAYMPTLAGKYNIYVRWGLKLINGNPFRVQVGEHDPGITKVAQTLNNSVKRRSTQFSHIKVYYSSSWLDPVVMRDTEALEQLLQRYGLTRSSSDDTWVSIDLELQKDERDLIFRLAGTKRLPLLFIHEQCLGSFEDICELDRRKELEERLMYKVRKV